MPKLFIQPPISSLSSPSTQTTPGLGCGDDGNAAADDGLEYKSHPIVNLMNAICTRKHSSFAGFYEERSSVLLAPAREIRLAHP